MDGDHDFLDRWTKTKDGDETKYSDLFGNKKFAGEITPVYSIMDCSEITKIYNALAKQRVDVFYMIRNPLFRDVSQIIFAMHRQKKRLEPYSLKEYRDFVDTAAFLKRSQYQKNYEKWQSVFGESVKIFYFDQLLKKPKVFFKKFCENYDISYDSARVKGMKMNKSGDKNRFQIKLPDELIAYLGERSIKNIENSTLYRNKIKVKWTEEIRVKMAMMQ